MTRRAVPQLLAWSLAGLALALALVGVFAWMRAAEDFAIHLVFGPVTAIAYGLVGPSLPRASRATPSAGSSAPWACWLG
jgi:hypothetical protein